MKSKGNPMLGARIPSEWMDKYQELAEARGCKVAELVRTALRQYLESQGDITAIIDCTPSPDLKNRISAIEDIVGDSSDIKVISQRLELLENQFKEVRDKVNNLESKKIASEPEKKTVITKKSVINTEDWLTTGEAHEEAQKKGLTQSVGTFRRWLREACEKEQLPSTLENLKLEANWEVRKQGNPKDNSLRWLRFN